MLSTVSLLVLALCVTESISIRLSSGSGTRGNSNYGGSSSSNYGGSSPSSPAPSPSPSSHCSCETSSKPKPHLLNPNDVAILLIDHQSGLLETVQDMPIRDLRINVGVLAKLADLANLPLITTASVPTGPNGPLIPEISEGANATYVARTGEVSAWEKAEFVQAVKATGKKTLVMAGIWTSVCVAFPAIQAIADGYTVYAVVDASGDVSAISSAATQMRMAQIGVVLTTTNALVAEVQRTWRRPDAQQYADLYAEFNVHYGTVIESYNGAQAAV
jgi:nicotinamidase-related amidase